MAFRNWWTRLVQSRTPSRSARRRRGPSLESLEDRTVPAVQAISHSVPLLSVPSTGNGTSAVSNIGSVSDDGRYVVYLSTSTNLVDNQADTNGANDVFLFDRQTGTNRLISRQAGTSSTAANGVSLTPTISGDGNWVAFASEATNMIAGVSFPSGSQFNPNSGMFLYDVQNNVLSLVTYKAGSTTQAAAAANIDTAQPSLSRDGRFLAFVGDGSDLIADYHYPFDSNSIDLPQDAYLYDRQANTITMVSDDPLTTATGGNEMTTLAAVSGNGNKVVFTSYATNLGQSENRFSTSPDLFVYDVGTKATTLITHDANSPTLSAASQSDQDIFPASISDDGRYVVYASRSNTLVTGITDGASSYDAFLYDTQSNTNTLVSKAGTTAQGAAYSLTTANRPVISGNGTAVAFTSSGSGLVSGVSGGPNVYLYTVPTSSNPSGSMALVSHAAGSPTSAVTGQTPTVSDDGRYVAYVSTTGSPDVYRYDNTDASVLLLSSSTASDTTPSGGGNKTPSISGDGAFTAWWGSGTNLVADDTNGKTDVFTNGPPVQGPSLSVTATNINEGDQTTLTGTITGGQSDALYTVTVNWGNGTEIFQNVPAGKFQYKHPYYDDDPTATAKDNQVISVSAVSGATTLSKNATIVISNVDPVLSNVTVTAATENDYATLTGTFTDVGTKDTHQLTVTWGDGSTDKVSFVVGDPHDFKLTHKYLDDDPTGTPSDKYPVSVTVTDDDTGSANTVVYSVVNNAPPALANVAVTNTVENGLATLTGTFTDVGTKDTQQVVVDWGDGKTDKLNFAVGDSHDFKLDHQYLDDDPTGTTSDKYPVTVTVTDDDTGSDTKQVYATVTNAAPVLANVAVTNTLENGTVTLTGTFTDVGTKDSQQLVVDWGDGSTDKVSFAVGAPHDFKLDHQYLDDGASGTVSDSYSVSVTVTDDDTGSANKVVSATVTNVAPVLTNLAVTDTAEGGTVTLTGSFTDPGTKDTHQLVVNWGDGTIDTVNLTLGSRDFTTTHKYLDDSPTGTASDKYSVSVTVNDDDTGSANKTVTSLVTNVAPVLSNVAVNNANEGGTATLTGTVTDPGTKDTFTLTVTWGDGAQEQVALPAGTTTFSRTHTYLDDNPTNTASDNYPVSVIVTDDDTGSTSAQVTAAVTNVAPSLSNVAVTNTVENGSVTLTGAITDPGTKDSFLLTVTWGDGATDTVAVAATDPRNFSLTHKYLDDNPTGTPSDNYPVNVTVTDDDTGTGSKQVTATVNNAAPVLTAVSLTDPDANGMVTLTGSFTDVGTKDTHQLVVNWGDGNTDTIDLTLGARTFSVPHQYLDSLGVADPPDHAVAVSVRDDDGGTGAGGVTTGPDRPPVLTAPPVVNVGENTTVVTTVTATDPDLPAQTLTLFLTGADAPRFAIDPATGVLTFVTPPDFENPGDANGNNVYQVTVNVSDGTVTASQKIAVTVVDVDEPPLITVVPSVNVDENTTTVTTVTAVDPDSPAQPVTFTLTGPDAAFFKISPAGVLKFITAPNFEAPQGSGGNTYSVTVVASDGTTTSSEEVTVTVADSEELPVLTVPPKLAVEENKTAVTTATTADPDAGQILRYTLTGSDSRFFQITSGGVLTFVNPPDFEHPGDADGDNIYRVTVNVSDGEVTTKQKVLVAVVDAQEPATGVAVDEVDVNGDGLPSPLDTHARVTSLVLTFSAPVLGTDPGAFTLTNGRRTLTDAPGGGIEVAVNGSTVTLTFDAVLGVKFGSLSDGVWSLTTNLSKVRTALGPGSGVFVTQNIRRLYGDWDGSGVVDSADLARYRAVKGQTVGAANYDAQFDFNADGVINSADREKYQSRLGKVI